MESTLHRKRQIVIPDNIKALGLGTFSDCRNLEKVDLPEGLISIGLGKNESRTFMNCTSLTSITIPSTVTSIDAYAFFGDINLKKLFCKSVTPPTLGPNCFAKNSEDNSAITDLTIYVPEESLEKYKKSEYWFMYSDLIKGYAY